MTHGSGGAHHPGWSDDGAHEVLVAVRTPAEEEGRTTAPREMLSDSRWALKLAASDSPGLVAARATIVVLNGIVPAAFVYGAKESQRGPASEVIDLYLEECGGKE